MCSAMPAPSRSCHVRLRPLCIWPMHGCRWTSALPLRRLPPWRHAADSSALISLLSAAPFCIPLSAPFFLLPVSFCPYLSLFLPHFGKGLTRVGCCDARRMPAVWAAPSSHPPSAHLSCAADEVFTRGFSQYESDTTALLPPLVWLQRERRRGVLVRFVASTRRDRIVRTGEDFLSVFLLHLVSSAAARGRRAVR